MCSIENDIFIITSVINTGNVGWSYYPQRSIFRPEERFEQTLKTIESIRTYSKGIIILVEAGLLLEDNLNILRSLCNYVYYLGEDFETKNNCLLSNCKGLGDSWLLYKGLEFIKNNNIHGRNIYKISGRYILNNNYNIDNISNILPTFKKVNDNCHVTFFFSVPFTLIYNFESIILNIINIMKNSSYISIESILPTAFKEKHIIETIGCEGIIAIDESKTLYKV